MAEEEKKKLKPIVNKEEITHSKKGFGKRLAETFIQGAKEDVKDHIIYDVIIPGVQDAFLDTMEMIFFGETSGKRRRGRDRGYTDYTAHYGGRSSRGSSRSRRDSNRDRDDESERVDYRDIVLRNRDDAYEIVDQLYFRIHETGAATIADLLDLVDLPTKPSDNDWGWESKKDISVRRVSNGYLIDVERARYVG